MPRRVLALARRLVDDVGACLEASLARLAAELCPSRQACPPNTRREALLLAAAGQAARDD